MIIPRDNFIVFFSSWSWFYNSLCPSLDLSVHPTSTLRIFGCYLIKKLFKWNTMKYNMFVKTHVKFSSVKFWTLMSFFHLKESLFTDGLLHKKKLRFVQNLRIFHLFLYLSFCLSASFYQSLFMENLSFVFRSFEEFFSLHILSLYLHLYLAFESTIVRKIIKK